jgi:glucosamine-6-phosphate deaminase
MVEGPVSSKWPAAVLQLHLHATVLLDEVTAGRLRLADYYREACAGRPARQTS